MGQRRLGSMRQEERLSELHFETILQSEGEGGACFLAVPGEVVTALSAGKRPPVLATLNGYQYRTTIAVYGSRFYLGVRRDIREAAGLAPGAAVSVSLALDEAPREVELPEDFGLALAADAEAQAVFARLSFSHRREYVDWIVGAKREATRRGRLEKTVARLKEGRKEP
jgi:hypothetical protein